MSRILALSRGWKLPLFSLFALLFALITVIAREPAPKKEPITMPPVGQFASNLSGIGVVEPASEIISIGTEIGGVVRQVHVKVGDTVKKGALLFSLDQRDIDAQINILESALEVAKVQAEDAKAQFAIVKDITDTRAVAKDDYNHRKYSAELATARISETQARLKQARITKERLNTKAPIDGQILSINVRPGEFANAGPLNEPLIRMGDTQTLHVRVEIDEENAMWVKKSAPAKGLLRGDPKNAIPLKFVRFEPYIRPKQNLAVSGQRVDTRVLQIIYEIALKQSHGFVGEQMDVYIEKARENKSEAQG
ncbi:MAG: efflux RND transporter periplasmic adaptor subunit [Candidatus Berkiella sp.]